MEALETLYKELTQQTRKLERDLDMPYLEALTEVIDRLNERHTENVDPETVRKAVSLAILEGMKRAQPNHLPTPDSVALFAGYLIGKLIKKGDVRLLDLGSGTGGMLHAVLSQLPKDAVAEAVEVDETLIRLSASVTELLDYPVNYTHQDGLRPLLLDPVDLAMADLPIGYYPDEDVAQTYVLKREEGMSYSHFLLIEQAMNYVKPGGFGVFVIPNGLFQHDTEGKLKHYFEEKAHVIGILQLPLTMFKQEQAAKSYLIVRNHLAGMTMPKQALLAELPSFTDARAFGGMVKQIDEWINTELK
ncbi:MULTISPECIES: class I SAM-dependent methyltransferase [Exiguobacterium]|uniref:Class I SAM-dependent methyltransferase n=1 Tax=Exiguobacterium antarcticum TaxID=132920 RepID=A0ABT6QXW6_9BACL|nr:MULTISPECIES: class I SAM-dependent methyltransferase [Exiguobacterium]MCT4781180.1 class I SAM-dependent methyltransferase [Exiguobacterium soli]MDI3233388.1 class I SAM-dependent methyltransferase [Exiguobacterium antarcticum]